MNSRQGQTGRRRTALAAGVALGGIVAVTPAIASAQQAPVQPSLASYFAAQDRALMPGTSDVSATLSSLYASGRAAAVLRNYQVDTAVGFHKWVAMHGDRYRSIRTSFSVRSLQQRGNTAVASVSSITTMLWSPHISSTHPAFTKEKAAEMASLKREGKLYGANDTITSRVGTTHAITLVRAGSSWRVVRDDYSDPLNMQFAPDHVTMRTGKRVPAAVPAPKSTTATGTTLHSMSFNRAAAQTYADKYWSNYNTPKYLNYNSSGGDCANFVSQVISDPAGGDAPWQSPYWYYNWYSTSPTGASPVDWRYAPSLHSFLLSSPQGSTYTDATQVAKGTYSGTLSTDKSSMQRGDVFFYDFTSDGTIDHTAVEATELSDGTSLIDAHNNNHYHVRYDLGTSGTIYLDHMHSTLYYQAPAA